MNPKIKEIADRLNGMEYGKEPDIGKNENNIVVVFGLSDDLMEFRGAIDDELDCYNGTTAHINSNGLFHKEEDYSWTYKTDIPHSTFDILEDGEKYCRGIVFALDELEG